MYIESLIVRFLGLIYCYYTLPVIHSDAPAHLATSVLAHYSTIYALDLQQQNVANLLKTLLSYLKVFIAVRDSSVLSSTVIVSKIQ